MSSSDEKPRSYNDLDLKLLWGLAAARCAYPGCRVLCIKEATDKDRASARRGRIAHIVAHSDNGPRSDPDGKYCPKDKRDKYENLILLCATHHDDVDAQDSTFTIEMLHEWKQKHEEWVKSSLAQQMPKVSFAELEVVCRGILSVEEVSDDDYTLTGTLEKMRKNGLTSKVKFYLDIGYAKVPEVKKFVNHLAILDASFPERLAGGFKKEYTRLFDSGLRGDSLFLELRRFASPETDDEDSFLLSAAGLAVLTYLFVICEVFAP